MLGFKRATESFECAATFVEPYTKSKIQSVSTSAMGSSFAYRQLMTASIGLVKSIKNELNLANTKEGDFADKITDFTVQSDKAWELIINSTVAATYATVIVPKQPDDLLTTLNMTAGQRGVFNARLLQIFGDVLKKPKEDLKSSSDATGWLLYGFLNDSDWQFQDK